MAAQVERQQARQPVAFTQGEMLACQPIAVPLAPTFSAVPRKARLAKGSSPWSSRAQSLSGMSLAERAG
jgi:hypothetical protein